MRLRYSSKLVHKRASFALPALGSQYFLNNDAKVIKPRLCIRQNPKAAGKQPDPSQSGRKVADQSKGE